MTNEIQQNRYDRLMRRVAGIIGPGSKVSEVLTELFPVLDVELVPSELLILMGTKTAFGSATIQGAAGEAPKVGVFNPAGSNTIITVTDVKLTQSSANSVVRWGIDPIELTTQNGVERFGDTRNPATQTPVGRIGQESSAAFADAQGQIRTTANQEVFLEAKNDLAILSPGFGFVIGGTILTSTIWGTFYWRERPLEPAEVNPVG